MENLSNFLKAHSANGSSEWTHTSIKNPKGSYIIDNNTLSEFYDLYNTALHQGNELYITERCNSSGSPIRIDIDFRIENKQNLPPATLKHFYNKNHYINLCKELWKIINTYINVDSVSSKIYLTEKKCPSLKSNGDIGDGFHIIFPTICCSSKFQLFIRQKLLSSGIFEKLFADIPCSNSIDDIYDKGIIDRNWTLYGSIGKVDGPLYKITSIIDIEGDFSCLDGQQELSDKLIDFLSVRNKENKINEFKADNLKFEIDTWYNNVYNVYKPSTNAGKRVITISSSKVVDIAQIKALVDVLSPIRASNYEDWVRVCWCLRNIDENLFEDFDKFSQKDRKKYDYQSILTVWNSPNRKSDTNETNISEKLQLGTLYYWAKKDNLEAYNEILDKDISSMISNHPKTNRGIANIIHKKYGTEFVCINPMTSSDKRIIYHFNGLIWCPKAYPVLRDYISNDTMKNYFTAEKQKFYDISTEF